MYTDTTNPFKTEIRIVYAEENLYKDTKVMSCKAKL